MPPREHTEGPGSAPGPLGPEELRLLAVFGKTLANQVEAQLKEYKHELTTGTGDPNVDMSSGEAKHVYVTDGAGEWHRVGTVRVDRAPVNVAVTDEAALVRWVAQHMPTETVQTVRPSALERLKADMKERGGWIVPGTGEVVPVPGLEVEYGDPRTVVRPAKGAAEAFGRVYAGGRLPQAGVVLGRALEMGPTLEY